MFARATAFSGDIHHFMDLEILTHKFYDYSHYIRNYSPATIRRYRQSIRLYQRYAELKNIEDINETNFRAFIFHGRTERKWCSNSLIIFYRTLNVFFQWCVQNDYLKTNPAKDIELPRREKTLPPRLTRQEAGKLLEVAYNYPYRHTYPRYRNHAIFSMFMFAGLRRSELLALKLTDVDIDNLTIFVRQGKGGKDRIIPMSSTLALSLRNYLNQRSKFGKTCAEFFTSTKRNIGFANHNLKDLVVRMDKALGCHLTIHKLRHTFATLMLEGGCDIYSLSRMMGHSDIKTTTIYLAASAEHLRSQMTKHPLNDKVRM